MILRLLVVIVVFCLTIGLSETAPAETITYSYYETGELKSAVYSNGSTLRYTYDLSGNRISKSVFAGTPGVSATPGSVDFGLVPTGSMSEVQTVIISNTGSVALDIESSDITGTNAADFTKQADTCSSQTIAAAGSCSIGLAFISNEPLAVKTAYLRIASNASGAPVLSINLSGTSYSNNSALLTVTRAGGGSGTVTVAPGSLIWNGLTGTAIYPSGTNVNISANASSDSRFESWSGDCLGNQSPCSIIMDANKSVTATFISLADFTGTPTTGSVPLTVAFSDLSVNSPSSWLWDFGDGSSSSLRNPSHVYTTPGSYTVSLTATGVGGAATKTKSGYVVVTSCVNQPVKRGEVFYSSIQSACDDIADGDSVKMMALEFEENVTLQKNAIVTLEGGYACDYLLSQSFTTIKGALSIRDATVVIDKIIIK